MAKVPEKPTNAEVADFLNKVAATTGRTASGKRGRLVFAMDATASREPSWDRACHIQGEMFTETAGLGGLEVQLVYYRGFGECRASRWASNGQELLRFMTSVRCLGGQTQIRKVLSHAIRETGKRKVDAVVFVGDAMEEDIDRLCHLAGELGLLGVPVFLFHEGGDPVVRRAFERDFLLKAYRFLDDHGLRAPGRDVLADVGANIGMIAIAAVQWAPYSRILRGDIMSIKERDFIDGARALGARGPRVVLRHILPNSLGPLLVIASLDIGAVVLIAAALSFLGLGAPVGYADWGQMISFARDWIKGPPGQPLAYWFVSAWPGLVIVVFVLGWNLLGDAVRDVLDVRS